MNTKMSFTVAGDYILQKRLPGEYEGFTELQRYICKGDARFFNFESTIPNETCFGNQFHGGAYLRSEPNSLDDARAYGFNMLSFANNHAMDFSYNGLLNTLDTVRKAGFVNAGVGRNLDEAAAPAYLDTVNGRVGLIAVASTMVNNAAMAGKQSRRVIGRPGLNGLRIDETVVVTTEQFETLREICDKSCVNKREDIMRAEGWLPELPEDVLTIKNTRFKKGDTPAFVTHPHSGDMKRVEKAIYEAGMMCDYIVVSVHSHELAGSSKENPGDFLVEFAHRCIDAGAHAVIGHGPHLLRPLEIYKNRPIFYSLGDFVFQEEVSQFAPEDLYELYELTSDSTMRELYRIRTKDYTRGLLSDRRFLESVVPYFEMEDGKLTRLELMPIELGFNDPRWQVGWPRPACDKGIIERLQQLSAPYGTKINIENGLGIVVL